MLRHRVERWTVPAGSDGLLQPGTHERYRFPLSTSPRPPDKTRPAITTAGRWPSAAGRQALHRRRRPRRQLQRPDAGQPVRKNAPHQRRRHDPGQPVRFDRRPGSTRRSIRLACATRSRSRSIWGTHEIPHQRRRRRAPGKRSTSARRARTTVGHRPKARPARAASPGPLFAFDHNSGSRHHRRILQRVRDHRRRASTRTPAPFPQAYRGHYYFTDLCTPVIGRIDLANGNAGLRIRQRVGLSGGHDGRQRWSAAGAQARRHHALHGALRATSDFIWTGGDCRRLRQPPRAGANGGLRAIPGAGGGVTPLPERDLGNTSCPQRQRSWRPGPTSDGRSRCA